MDDPIEKVLISAAAIEARLDAMALELEKALPAEPHRVMVIVLLKGAWIFAADLVRRIPRPLEIQFITVSSYHGGTESAGRLDWIDRQLPNVSGRHVLLLDDILDSGLTLHQVTEKLAYAGAASVRIAVLLSKNIQRAAEIRADHVGFQIDNEFVVGYGLDYQQLYRNLPYVAVLKQPEEF